MANTNCSRLFVYADASLQRYCRIKAAERGVSISNFVISVLHDYQKRDVKHNQELEIYYTNNDKKETSTC